MPMFSLSLRRSRLHLYFQHSPLPARPSQFPTELNSHLLNFQTVTFQSLILTGSFDFLAKLNWKLWRMLIHRVKLSNHTILFFWGEHSIKCTQHDTGKVCTWCWPGYTWTISSLKDKRVFNKMRSLIKLRICLDCTFFPPNDFPLFAVLWIASTSIL